MKLVISIWKEKIMEDKKFQSIVRRVVLFPLTVLVIVMIITIVSCLFSFFNMQQQMIDSNVNSLQISMNQLENLLTQIDHAFIEYWNSNESYQYLKNYNKETPKEEYFVYEADTMTWLSNQASAYTEVQGAFAYYENLDLFIFRGSSNYEMHQYIRERIGQEGAVYNHWELVNVAEEQYLMNLKNYGSFYGGVWIPVQTLEKSLSLVDSGFMGTVYLIDARNRNNLQNENLKERLNQDGRNVEKVKNDGETFYNYSVSASSKDIFDPDTLFVAIGAKELVPPIKGIDSPKVVMACDAELNPSQLGKKVAIMGGGFVGGEAAISFHHEGRECSVIEMKSVLVEEVNNFYRGALTHKIEDSATIYLDTKVKEIVEEGVLCERDGEEFVIEADSVVCALGFRAPYDKVDELCELVDEYYIIGDCNNVGQIYQAMNSAYYAAQRV